MSNQSVSRKNLCKWAGIRSEWELLSQVAGRATRIYLWGPPGVGKSYAAFDGQSPAQITLAGDITIQELLGMYVPEGNVFRWHDGPVATAMRNGTLLVINELGRASDAVKDILLGVLDDPEVASLALPSGEKLRPAPGFRVVATSNSPPDDLDRALRSRFEIELNMAGPNPGLISRLNDCLPGLGDALLDSFLDPERALDPRKTLCFGRLVRSGIRARPAALGVFGSRAPDVLAALSTRGVQL